MAVWKGVQIALSTIACVVGAIGWGLYIVGFAIRINDKTYSVQDVYPCTDGAGSVLSSINAQDRVAGHFAAFQFFAWWALVVAGPIFVLLLVINQLVVSFHQRVITIGVVIFLTWFVAAFFFGVSGVVMNDAAQSFSCSTPGHIRYAGEHYFVTLEFAGVCVATIFLGLALFFQFLLALCRFKKNIDYDVGCGVGLCTCGVIVEDQRGPMK
jgi:hypothetical protein